MQLTVLGTATPFPVPGNACSGYLLRSGGVGADARPTTLWIDAGAGTLAELQRHVGLEELDAIFLSHRHADHTSDLLVAYYALRFGEDRFGEERSGGDQFGVKRSGGASARVKVFGPEGLSERLAGFLGPDSISGLASVFDFSEMHGWGEAAVGDLGLAWGPVSHGVPAFGLTVTETSGGAAGADDDEGSVGGGVAGADDGEGSVGGGGAGEGEGAGEGPAAATGAGTARRGFTYSGDTAPCISLVELAEESTTLLCEVGYSEPPTGEYVHCTPEDAGRQASEAGVETLILTHLARGLEPSAARVRARSTFSGAVQVATSGTAFAV